MARLVEEQLKAFALAALEEAAASAHDAPVKRTWALRLVLAYLASRASSRTDFERWPFDEFWRSIANPDRWRWQSVNAALNGIYRAIGERRDGERTTRFESSCRVAIDRNGID